MTSLPESVNHLQIERFKQTLNEALVSKAGKISQRDLCKELDITIGTMTKYLRGEVNPFDVKTRITRNLARFLKKTPEALYNFYENGEYTDEINIDSVESWIRSQAAQEDLPRLLDSLAFNQTQANSFTKAVKKEKPKELKFTDEGAKAFLKTMQETFDTYVEKYGLTREEAVAEVMPIVIKQGCHPTFYGYAADAMMRSQKFTEIYDGEFMSNGIALHDGVCPLATAIKEWTKEDLPQLDKEFADAVAP